MTLLLVVVLVCYQIHRMDFIYWMRNLISLFLVFPIRPSAHSIVTLVTTTRFLCYAIENLYCYGHERSHDAKSSKRTKCLNMSQYYLLKRAGQLTLQCISSRSSVRWHIISAIRKPQRFCISPNLPYPSRSEHSNIYWVCRYL